MDVVELALNYLSYWWEDFKKSDVSFLKSVKNERRGVTLFVGENNKFFSLPSDINNISLESLLKLFHSIVYFLNKNLYLKKLKHFECLRYTVSSPFDAYSKLIEHWIETEGVEHFRADFKFGNGVVLAIEEIEPV